MYRSLVALSRLVTMLGQFVELPAVHCWLGGKGVMHVSDIGRRAFDGLVGSLLVWKGTSW